MRILRGKSNLEVSSNGFALFVVGLIIATFIGGGVRTILGSDRVHQRIQNELRTRFPADEIRIGATEVLLSRGIWPGLGLKISELSFKRETCGKLSVSLEIPTVILPISLWSLRKGEVRLGNVEVQSGKAHLQNKPCLPAATGVPTQDTAKSEAPVAAPTEKKSWTPPRFDWEQISKHLGSMDVRDFALTFEEEPTWKVQVRDAELEFGRDFAGHAAIDVQKSLPFGTLNHLLDLEAHGENSVLQFQVQSEFKEGRVMWKGSWDTRTQSAMSSLDLNQMPIKELLGELYQMGFLENEVQIRSAWLSCQANWEGVLNKLEENPLKIRACKMEGAYGAVQMDLADFYPLHQDRLKVPVQFKIQNLQVQPLVEAFNKQILPAVINRLGVWSGQFEYLNKNSWSLDGFLDGAEVVFSNQSVRGKQQLRRIHTVAHRVEGLVAAKVDQVEISDGKFLGLIEATLNDDWKTGTLSVNVQNIAFSPGIQTLLTGGTWTELKLIGNGQMINGELREWKGVMESPRMQGAGWVAEKVMANSRFQSAVFNVDARMDTLELANQWRYYPQVREHLGVNGEALQWKDIRAKMEVRKAGGEIQTFTAVDSGNGKTWRGRGSWQRERELVAYLSGVVDSKAKNFSIRAEKGFLTMDESSRAP